MPIYGPSKEEDLLAVWRHAKGIQDIYNNYKMPNFVSDNMIALNRSLSFVHDKKFFDTFKEAAADDLDFAKLWRLHVYCWAGRSALSVAGDFVECGVYKGFYSAVLVRYLSFAACRRQMYLYDTFDGLPEGQSSARERELTNPYYEWDGTYEDVDARFAEFPNVHVIKGTVPDILNERAPERIALLHLDMNAAAAETATLDHLFDRVSDGGIILMDDYGRCDLPGLFAALYHWMQNRGYAVLELPTGQGMVIKRDRPPG